MPSLHARPEVTRLRKANQTFATLATVEERIAYGIEVAEREGLPGRSQKPNKIRHLLQARWRRVYQSCVSKSTEFCSHPRRQNASEILLVPCVFEPVSFLLACVSTSFLSTIYTPTRPTIPYRCAFRVEGEKRELTLQMPSDRWLAYPPHQRPLEALSSTGHPAVPGSHRANWSFCLRLPRPHI